MHFFVEMNALTLQPEQPIYSEVRYTENTISFPALSNNAYGTCISTCADYSEVPCKLNTESLPAVPNVANTAYGTCTNRCEEI